ncbi:helix-turn-helix domain-containing protein [Sulfuriroseicoccus oceanibius]|uniref:Helix-turn-helix domain-containing protein n=1 Tax=Sulfuriroseicoccus oceanibius TaxID=2707525 RepID=A0A6B3L8M3_9BACT|nr:helix-turn-helix domain-containing protein [Sulfuriroseicoccus oceanibius]QQL44229.1 helix-turn-helix domain-containing protein [Sulfuriroseicoccus oceanibius]
MKVNASTTTPTERPTPSVALAPNELIDTAELARRLKVTRRSIDNYRAQGRIPAIKIGQCVRFNWLRVIEALEGISESK